ncbi:MAG: site-specific DNA-methyltransferase [Desulfosarcina sp.]|jgi:DNA modification methylase
MKTEHRICFGDSSHLSRVDSSSVHLVVTSPPYPMIDVWDDCFCTRPPIRRALKNGEAMTAFGLMHRELDRVWKELHRVLVPGGMACINIGDATRSMDGAFALYPNHSRVMTGMLTLGFRNLPNILWRKQTNAPNKFMGSGMLPPGAYVTLEHEHILIFRKGTKRQFKTQEEKVNRRQSAFFWEERNNWFSDVWMDLKGIRQSTGNKNLRKISAAYPFELAYRLICMFSVMGDTVLDPFLGTGTTMAAAVAAGRNSIGYEVESSLASVIRHGYSRIVEQGRQRIEQRFNDHLAFVETRQAQGKPLKYTHWIYGFPVVTRQETELLLPVPDALQETADDHLSVSYDRPDVPESGHLRSQPKRNLPKTAGQPKLFNG